MPDDQLPIRKELSVTTCNIEGCENARSAGSYFCAQHLVLGRTSTDRPLTPPQATPEWSTELALLRTIVNALESMPLAARNRTLRYLMDRYHLT